MAEKKSKYQHELTAKRRKQWFEDHLAHRERQKKMGVPEKQINEGVGEIHFSGTSKGGKKRAQQKKADGTDTWKGKKRKGRPRGRQERPPYPQPES